MSCSNHTRVVSLSEAAEKTSGRRRVDDSSILLLSKVWPSSFRALQSHQQPSQATVLIPKSYLVRAVDVDLVDQIPVEISHVLERDISENASIVDEDIDAAKVLDGGVNDLLAELDAVVVGSGLAAGLPDLLDNEVCGLFIHIRQFILLLID